MDDEFVGRVFADADQRSVGRRVRVIARVRSMFGERYRAVRINAQGQEMRGHPLNLTRAELENEYRREGGVMVEAEGTSTADRKQAAAELRGAAEEIRKVLADVRQAGRGAMPHSGAAEVVRRHKAIGFSRTVMAAAVADLLEEAADAAWLGAERPSEAALAVAKVIREAH